MTPAERLLCWSRDNPHAPTWWRELALRIAGYESAAEMWRSLPARLRDEPMFLFALARDAYKVAADEMARPDEMSDENKALRRVALALRELEDAIIEAPLPKGTAWMRELTAQGLPPLLLRFGWADIDHEEVNALGGFPLAISDVIAAAKQLLEENVEQRPQRLAKRRRDIPGQTIFVRRLHVAAERALGAPMTPEALAHVANAALGDADNPLDAAAVRPMVRRLKAAPPAR